MESKVCRSCGHALPLDAYYRHAQMTDGHLNFCKECVKARARLHRSANLEQLREYDRQRADTPARVALRAKRAARAKADPAIKKRDQEARNKWARRNASKISARIAVNNAVAAGKLKVTPCARCSHAIGLQAHHEDYSKPLDVVWLCKPCHGQRHREINAERRAKRAA